MQGTRTSHSSNPTPKTHLYQAVPQLGDVQGVVQVLGRGGVDGEDAVLPEVAPGVWFGLI